MNFDEEFRDKIELMKESIIFHFSEGNFSKEEYDILEERLEDLVRCVEKRFDEILDDLFELKKLFLK